MTDEVYVIDPDNDEINHIGGSVTVEGETMEYTFDFYSPLDPPYSDNNDYSPIMVLSYAGRDIVLSGDAEARNEAEFVEKVTETDTDERYDRFRTGDFTADVIKLGHHGSSTSSSEAYLDIMCSNVNARCNTYTVFSCNDRSYGNDYGHPTAITLQRIMDMEFSPERIERTDLSGNIRFDVGADGALMCTEETPGVTALSRLVSGENEKNPETQIADNGVRPTEPNGSVATDDDDPTTAPGNPLLDLWNGLTDTQRTIAIVVVIIVVIVILAILIAAAVHKNKKRKKRRR